MSCLITTAGGIRVPNVKEALKAGTGIFVERLGVFSQSKDIADAADMD